MTPHNLVKEAFLLIMAMLISFVLYFLLFGFEAYSEDNTVRIFSYDVKGIKWSGALWYAARQIEVPIGGYYYKYCYAPCAHNCDYLDRSLGCTLPFSLYSTDASILVDDSYVNYDTATKHYTEGWYDGM